MDKTRPSILRAVTLLNQGPAGSEATKTETVGLPTAKSRAALELLFRSAPKDLSELSLKPFLQDVFNWDGANKVNKPLIGAFHEAVNAPGKYAHAVELTAYLAALAPLLEPDQLARMYAILETTETAFAPTLYTLNFHNNIKRAFAELPQARVEQIGLSLWREAHKGRWWNLTVGLDNNVERQQRVPPAKILKSVLGYSKDSRLLEHVIWSPENQLAFQEYMAKRLDPRVAQLSEKVRLDLMRGETITPDIAIFLSSINWLAPDQRPESPINSLLKTLADFREDETRDYELPKKPKTIQDLFPSFTSIVAQEVDEFPIDWTAMRQIVENIGSQPEFKAVELIKSDADLVKNANYMRNCTLTYQGSMEQGQYLLLKITDTKDKVYNVAVLIHRSRWIVGQMNSRFNNGVSSSFRKAVTDPVAEGIPVSDDYTQYLREMRDIKRARKKSYSYSYSL